MAVVWIVHIVFRNLLAPDAASHRMLNIDDASAKALQANEIDQFKKDKNWQFSMMPKTIVGILTFIAAAKLLSEYDLAAEWYDLATEMLAGQSTDRIVGHSS